MKNESIEINLEEFTKEELISLIEIAHSKNITFNDCIVFLIKKVLNEFKTIERLRAERANSESKE